MSISLNPLPARRTTVGAADDPFKKYWWVILVGFGVTGTWMLAPMMETQVGSTHVDTAAKAASDPAGIEQNLDSAGPAGAPGSALDLSMGGLKHKSRSDEEIASMLYQAPPEAGAAASGAPIGAAGAAAGLGTASGSVSASLAQQLKDAGKAKSSSGWDEKARSGFSAAHLSGSGLSGLGGSSGGSSASAGAGAVGAFGYRNAQTGFESTVGLRDNGAEAGPGMQGLRKAASAGPRGLTGSAESMKAAMGSVFDGTSKRGGAQIGPGGTGAMASAQAAYDVAPANLKVNDPKLNARTMTDPPVAATPQSTNSNDFAKQLAMMAATALIGGMIPGVGGQMVMMMGMMMMQQQQQQAAANAAAQQQNVHKRYGT